MKHGLKIMIATLAVSSALLAACGKSGGDSGATNAAPAAAAPAWTSNFPAGFVGNGTYQGQVILAGDPAGRAAYLQMAAISGLCGGYGCQSGSYMNIQLVLQSNGYGGTYGYGTTVPVGTSAGTTIGGFAISSGSGTISRRVVYTTGSPAGFSMAVGIANRTQNGQPPVAGEPSITINGQFTDQTMTVLNVQVIYTSNETGPVTIASGTITGQPTGGYGQQYGQPGYGQPIYGQAGYGYGQQPVYGGGYSGGVYFGYSTRR